MAKGTKAAKAAKSTDDTAMTVVAYSDATALGEDTLTSVNTNIRTKDNGHVTKSKGTIETIAVAESPDGDAYVYAVNDVTASSADLIIIKTKNKTFEGDGESYTVSLTKFKAIDIEGKDGPTKVIEHTKNKIIDDSDIYIDLDGNVSTVTFDVQAFGENSLAIVDSYALTVEDQMSVSTIMAVTAAG